MKCPICGNELKLSEKKPGYALCHNCRKKFKLPKRAPRKAAEQGKPVSQTADTPKSKAPVLDDELTDRTQIFSREEVRDALRKANAARKAEKAAGRTAEKKASRVASRQATTSAETESNQDDDVEFHLRYANIPPKEVREKQEREMRKAYDELLSIGKEERSTKKRGLFGRRK